MKIRRIATSTLAPIIAVAIAASGSTAALAQSDAGDDGPPPFDPMTGDPIVVVGSRMEAGDETANTQVITSREIEARGLTSAEDIIRSIPQNYATVNSATNLDNDPRDVLLGNFGLGVVSANLRGLGTGNTLVLVNGRRIAGAAGQPEFFANLRDIPAASIERVEINLDGGSAVYGSDAVAGTINIVLKKGYNGGRLTGLYEYSNTGADRRRLSANYGVSWTSGSVSISGSYTETDPVLNAKAGYTSLDFREQTGDPDANFNAFDYGFFQGFSGTGERSAIICDPSLSFFGCSAFGPYNAILQPGLNGTNFTYDQLQPLSLDDFEGFITREATAASKDYSVTFNAQQQLTDFLQFNLDAIYNKSKLTRRIDQIPGGTFLIPASNAFNNTGEDVAVRYTPIRESEQGLIDLPQQRAETEFWSVAAGAEVSLSDTLDFVVEYAHSENDAYNEQFAFSANPAPFAFFSPVSPETQALIDRLAEILADSDPATAPNFFGDGSVQNASIAEFLIPIANQGGGSTLDSFTGYFRGQPFELGGGSVNFILGGEYRAESFAQSQLFFGINSSSENTYGVAAPERKLYSAFGEISLPLIGEANKRQGINRLTVNAQLRYDDYNLRGADGLDDDFEPNIIDVKYDSLTASLGMLWEPVDHLEIRAKYSEGFRAPNTTDVLSAFADSFPSFDEDPLTGAFVPVIYTDLNNVDLKPERSKNYSLGVTAYPLGDSRLMVRANYSHLDFKDRIARNLELRNLLPTEIYGNLDEFFIRDPNGVLIEVVNTAINVSRRVSDNLDFEINGLIGTDSGTFRPGLYVNYVVRQYDEAVPGSGKVSRVGDIRGVDRYNVIASLNWTKGSWTADFVGTYTPGYTNSNFDDLQGPVSLITVPDVDDRFVVDLSASREFGNGLTLRVGARNLLNADFPFALNGAGIPYDAARVDLRGRVLFASASFDF